MVKEVYFSKNHIYGEGEKAKIKEEYKKEIEPLRGNMEIQPSELKFVEKMNGYIKKEFDRLGLDGSREINPNSFCMLSEDEYNQLSTHLGYEFYGITVPDLGDKIFINRTDLNRLETFGIMLHEALHAQEIKKYRVEDKESGEVKRYPYREGYVVHNPSKEANHEHFRGLEEAVMDCLTRDILLANRDDIYKTFRINTEEIETGIKFDKFLHLIFSIIVLKIASKKNIKPAILLDQFKREIFSGNILFLKDVDKFFGKGTLRFLASIDRCKIGNLPLNAGNESRIRKFFTSSDEEERDATAKELLSGAEFEKYQKWKYQGYQSEKMEEAA